MPTITIDSEGHYLYYEDTGVPQLSSGGIYSTLIIVHGTAFHKAVFKRLLPLAPQYNIRLVLVNRRDYPNSSPYTDKDLEKLKSTDDWSQNEFAKGRAEEYATFIKQFVEQERIPEMTVDGKDGGIVLLSWSSGVAYTIPLLSFADCLSEDVRGAIDPYLRSYVSFDAARWVLGLPPMDHGFGVLRDPSLSKEERAERFNEWVSAYYTHASLTSRDINDLQLFPGSNSPRGTVARMSKEELKEVTCPEAVERSDAAIRGTKPEFFAERVRLALYDDRTAQYLPKCRFDVIYCEKTGWAMVDSAWAFQKLREKADEEGIKGRPLKIYMMPNANHFPHWDLPEETMRFFAEVMKA